MNKLFSICLFAFVFASCQNTGDRKATTTPSAPAAITLPSTPSLDSNNIGVTTNTATTTNSAATGAVNPEHGAPGHRCEIAVGAPLNSAASAPATTNNVAPVTLKPQLPAMPAANSNARLNPAHGAPGHNCAIPVGSPL